MRLCGRASPVWLLALLFRAQGVDDIATLCASGLDPSMLNDDYCDCEEDGSDEPGTAACSHVQNQHVHFMCKNTFHLPTQLHTSKVNDGVCDCCDGSDEFQFEGLCENTCEAQGNGLREAAREHHRLILAGYHTRTAWIQETNTEAAKQEQEAQKVQAVIETFEEVKLKIEYLKRREEEKEFTMRVATVRKARERARGDRQITAKQIRGGLRRMSNSSSNDEHGFPDEGGGLHVVTNCKIIVTLVDETEAEVALLPFLADALGVNRKKRSESSNADPLSKRPVVTKTGKNRMAERRRGILRAVLNAKKGDTVGQRLALERLLEAVGLVVFAPPRAAWELTTAAMALLGWGVNQFQWVAGAVAGQKGGQMQNGTVSDTAPSGSSAYRKVRRQVRQIASALGMAASAEFMIALAAGTVPSMEMGAQGEVFAYSEVYEEGTLQYYLAVMWGAWPEYFAHYFPQLDEPIVIYDEAERLLGHELQDLQATKARGGAASSGGDGAAVDVEVDAAGKVVDEVIGRAIDLESPTAHSLRLAMEVATKEHAKLIKSHTGSAGGAWAGGSVGAIQGICLPFLCSESSSTIASLAGMGSGVDGTVDFGPERAFEPLHPDSGGRDGCARLVVQGYEYIFCAFANVTQAKVEEGGGRGARVLLGKWKGWEQGAARAIGARNVASDALLSPPSLQSLDEPGTSAATAPAGSLRGLGYTRMHFTKGTKCHGGTHR
jgi:hypothetical protein